jgi:hypothetical protein
MDYTTLLRVAGELRRRLLPGRVENAVQPDDYRCVCVYELIDGCVCIYDFLCWCVRVCMGLGGGCRAGCECGALQPNDCGCVCACGWVGVVGLMIGCGSYTRGQAG